MIDITVQFEVNEDGQIVFNHDHPAFSSGALPRNMALAIAIQVMVRQGYATVEEAAKALDQRLGLQSAEEPAVEQAATTAKVEAKDSP